MYLTQTKELDADSPAAAQPHGIRIALRPHQLCLLHKCIEMEQGRVIELDHEIDAKHRDSIEACMGIIGDMVGSGKSYVLLSLVLQDHVPVVPRKTLHVFGLSRVTMKRTSMETPNPTGNTLIVIPHNIANQWENYVKTFSSELAESFVLLNKSNAMTNLDSAELFRSKRLVIVTAPFYNMLARNMQSKRVSLRRLVFDEADSLRIPACCYVENDFTWFVTASFGNLLYPRGFYGRLPGTSRDVIYASGLTNSGYIRQVFNDLYSCASGKRAARALVVKNKDDFVQASIELPPMMEMVVQCVAPRYISMLYGFVDNAILDRLNAGDVEGAIQLMNPDNCDSAENIVNIFIEKYEEQLQKYQRRIEAYRKLVAENEEEHNMFEAEITSMTTKAYDLQRKVEGIRSRITDNECSICLSDIKNKAVVKCCVIPLCFECIQTWMQHNNRCPFCKNVLFNDDIMVVKDKSIADRLDAQSTSTLTVGGVSVDPKKDKLFNLEQILLAKKDQDARFLICSSFDGSFDQVSRILRKVDMPFSFLKGNTAHVNSTVKGYESGRIRVLLVNGANYGSGMNLVSTTDIVMFHRFENELQKQVVGRAQRYGRAEPLNVWYLLHENEVA